MELSPKFQAYATASGDWLVKCTAKGLLQETVSVVVNAATGLSLTVTDCSTESVQVPKLVISFTWYVPPTAYFFKGLIADEKVPSPKLHLLDTGEGLEVLTNKNGCCAHIVSVLTAAVIVGNGFTVMVTVAESTQVFWSVTITVYVVVVVGAATGLKIFGSLRVPGGDH